MKEGVQKLFDKLSSTTDPASATQPTTAIAVMTGPQASIASWPKFSVSSDEPETVGGGDSAPPPSSIFAASIGFAENVTFARQAALHGMDFDSLETRVEARWDRRGIFGIQGIDPSITEVLIETKVKTAAPPEKVVELLLLTDRRCPMTRTVAKAASIHRELFVNGREIDL